MSQLSYVGQGVAELKYYDYIFEQQTVRVYIKKPEQCTSKEKETFINLVISGNQNTVEHVKYSFDDLVWVGLLYDNGEIKAVSSLKEGDSSPFYRAGMEDIADEYPYEVGFSYTDPSSRGKGYNTTLKKKLFAKVGNRGIYATIRVNNKESMSVNKKLGFVPMGKPYKGIVTDVQLMTLSE